MHPNIWGPGAWIFLHSITLNYPMQPTIQDKKLYYDFFHHVSKILPCETCSTHFQKLLGKYPINFFLESRDTLTKWLVKLHNEINLRLHKPTVSYAQFQSTYKQLYRATEKPHLTILFYKKRYYQFLVSIIILLLILAVGVYFGIKHKVWRRK